MRGTAVTTPERSSRCRGRPRRANDSTGRSAFETSPFGDGLVPFLIDWGDSPHPAESAPSGCRFRELRAEHPDPEPIVSALRALDVELALERGPEPAICVCLEGPGGRIELR